LLTFFDSQKINSKKNHHHFSNRFPPLFSALFISFFFSRHGRICLLTFCLSSSPSLFFLLHGFTCPLPPLLRTHHHKKAGFSTKEAKATSQPHSLFCSSKPSRLNHGDDLLMERRGSFCSTRHRHTFISPFPLLLLLLLIRLFQTYFSIYFFIL
jgi:hypothetical protein